MRRVDCEVLLGGAMPGLIGIGELSHAINLHPNTIRKLADRGEIPSTRTQGGQRRFNLAEVEDALSTKTKSAYERINSLSPINMPGIRWQREFSLFVV